MHKNLIKPIFSSFLSCEKDMETILKKLFIEYPKHARELKKLLIINTKDCLDNPKYDSIVDKFSLKDLIDKGYIRTNTHVKMKEFEEVKSYIYINFDNFTPNATNMEFRDCNFYFTIICDDECWDLGDYRQRPLKIAGYIDGLLQGEKLSGIGECWFSGCTAIADNYFSGYVLAFNAIHGSDDFIPSGTL